MKGLFSSLVGDQRNPIVIIFLLETIVCVGPNEKFSHEW